MANSYEAEPDLIAAIHSDLSQADPRAQSCALFDVEDRLSAATQVAWDGAEGKSPAERFGAALQVALTTLCAISRAMAAGQGERV